MIIMHLKGGMGNQMFQYAFGRATALRLETELKLDTSFLLSDVKRPGQTLRKFDLDLFNLVPAIASVPEINRLTVFVDESRLGPKRYFQKAMQRASLIFNKKHKIEARPEFDNSVVASIGKDCYLDGYWQSEKYFEPITDIIRQEFTFKTALSELSLSLSKEIVAVNAVAVFIRRTDYVANPAHIMLDDAQIQKGLDYLKARVDEPHIFVFSDEIDWCKKNLHFDLPTFFVTEEYKGARFADHFRLMSMCKHFIIPISSFAWWAAWLCENPGKIVLHAQNPNGLDWSANGWLEINDSLH